MTDTATLDLDFVRRQFPNLGNGWAYFENAGGSYLPQSVIKRMTDFMSESQVQPAALNPLSALSTERLDTARGLMARMINAETDEIVIGPSTTLNVYVLAQALRPLFRPGDEIIVTNQDHEANSGAWRRLAEFGIEVREWRIDPVTGELDPADLDRLLSERTRLVCFPQVSNIVGTVNPVAEITAKAHAAGAMVCVDAVAYAAHRLMDVKALDVDFYLFSLYKLYGPHVALLYGKRERILEAANQNHFFHEDNISAKLNPGGLNYEAVASLSGIVEYFEAVYQHHFEQPENDLHARLGRVFGLFAEQEQRLSEPFLAYLADKPGVRLIGGGTPGDRRLPTFSFAVEGRRPAEVVEALGRERIAINHGHFYAHRCVEGLGVDPEEGLVRASMVHYNTGHEVDRLIQALDAVV
ncbi:MAG: aminotransferase class V-fold PLP-dependent enzyme [Rhodospirillales bacterium]|nr:aminotransferase class V-fold PLP-dependent enzyme [Rhodospirillales bacterium]MDH3913369.1 aminotransferase class V-fold PLP-dependent enzyme [Rhodospirillales bacterium]MDH3968915.1 aminotransferase class V-fold PLP-dependent enzyme [Rhodospirillales bacterium]